MCSCSRDRIDVTRRSEKEATKETHFPRDKDVAASETQLLAPVANSRGDAGRRVLPFNFTCGSFLRAETRRSEKTAHPASPPSDRNNSFAAHII